MKTIPLPQTGLQWRAGHSTPPDVQTGTWCPLDDTTLQPGGNGWACPTCLGAWDWHGTHGRWLPVDVAVPVVRAWWSAPARIAAVSLPAAAGLTAVAAFLGESLVFIAAGALAAAALLIVVGAWLAGVVERARMSRVSVVLGTTAALGLSDNPRVAAAQLAARRAVSDGR